MTLVSVGRTNHLYYNFAHYRPMEQNLPILKREWHIKLENK